MGIPTCVCLLLRKAHAQYDSIMDGCMIAYLEYVCICIVVYRGLCDETVSRNGILGAICPSSQSTV